MVGQSVVVTGSLAIEEDADGGLGGGTVGGGGGDGQDSEGDVLNRWEGTIATVILDTEPNAPLACAPGLELHHPITSMLGGHGGHLDRYR